MLIIYSYNEHLGNRKSLYLFVHVVFLLLHNKFEVRLKWVQNPKIRMTHLCMSSIISLCTGPNTMLLSARCPSLTQGPILWLPMTCSEHSRVLPLRLDWLLGDKPKHCLYCPNSGFTHAYSIESLDLHRRLQLPISFKDPMFFILNKLLQKASIFYEITVWSVCWTSVFIILHEMDHLFHDQIPSPPLDPGSKLVNWLSS